MAQDNNNEGEIVTVSRLDYFRSSLKDLPEISLEPKTQLFGSVMFMAIGLSALMKNDLLPGLVSESLAAGLIVGPYILKYLVVLPRMLTRLGIEDIYNGSREKVTKLNTHTTIVDGARGCFFGYGSLLNGLYSTIDFKSGLLKYLVKNAKSPNDIASVWGTLVKCPDPELKLEGIRLLTQSKQARLKKSLKEFLEISKPPGSEFEHQGLAILKSTLNGENKMEQNLDELTREGIKKTWLSIITSREICSKAPPSGVEPFIKLYTLRRIMEFIAQNKVLKPNDNNLIKIISREIDDRLRHFNVLNAEKKVDIEKVTCGMEMQPVPEGLITLLRVNSKDLKEILEITGLGNSTDKPFEIVFPPSRTPMIQALMLYEVLTITGVPIEQTGIQLNFGGVSTESDIRALQRIIIASGLLQPDILIMKELGAYWSLQIGQSEIGQRKGEYNIRTNKDKEFVNLYYDHNVPQEFESVGEVRCPLGAVNFYTFYRGLLQAYELANMTKAYRKARTDEVQLTPNEKQMVNSFSRLLNKFGDVLHTHNIQDVHSEWTKGDWKAFSRLIEDKNKNPFIKHITEAFKNKS